MHLARLRQPQWRFHQGATNIIKACRRRPFPARNLTNSNASSDTDIDDENVASKNKSGSILFLSPSNWPEPNATAAGVRTMSLLRHFSAPASSFVSVHFGCGAKIPESLHSVDKTNTIRWHQIEANRSDKMENLLHKIQNNHGPIQAVVFDRFYAEEAFSFKIREMCPNALLVLDMQDIHSLRLGRKFLVEEMDHLDVEADRSRSKTARGRDTRLTKRLMDEVMGFDPSLFNGHGSKRREKVYDTFLRELASVYRSDLVLVCSIDEMKLLESWKIPKWKLVPASFFCMEPGDDVNLNKERGNTLSTKTTSNAFEDRKDFVIVGGFKHAPNVDAVKLLRYQIWPKIRDRLPDAKMHVYGAYPTPLVLSMHDPKSGFIVHGQVGDIDEVLFKSRVLLAPLRFGAGVKGKIVDAWRCGCPVVTTPVGAEGMGFEFRRHIDANQLINKTDASWGGTIASDTNEFANAAVKAYTQKEIWKSCQDKGANLLNLLFDGGSNLPVVETRMCDAITNLGQRRRLDATGAILWRESQRSTKYFSKWIELKESLPSKLDSN